MNNYKGPEELEVGKQYLVEYENRRGVQTIAIIEIVSRGASYHSYKYNYTMIMKSKVRGCPVGWEVNKEYSKRIHFKYWGPSRQMKVTAIEATSLVETLYSPKAQILHNY